MRANKFTDVQDAEWFTLSLSRDAAEGLTTLPAELTHDNIQDSQLLC